MHDFKEQKEQDLGTKISLEMRKERIKITISYYKPEDGVWADNYTFIPVIKALRGKY